MENQTNVTSISIKPEYEAIKIKILKYYYDSLELTTQAIFTNHPQIEKEARMSLLNLSKALAFKIHLIKDDDKIKYFKNFISKPQEYDILNIEAVFSICSLIMEQSGLNDVSTLSYAKKDAHLEVL